MVQADLFDDEQSRLELVGGWSDDDELSVYCEEEVNLREPQVRQLIAHLQAWCDRRQFAEEVPNAR